MTGLKKSGPESTENHTNQCHDRDGNEVKQERLKTVWQNKADSILSGK
jgi:hypothetical protein